MDLMRRFIIPLFIALIFFFLCGSLSAEAQSDAPWQIAEALDQQFFAVQKHVLLGNQDEANAALDEAEALLSQLVNAGLPAVSEEAVQEAIEMARQGIVEDNSNMLAAAKGHGRTAVLLGSYLQTIAAIEAGDVEMAQAWLLVRDFRTSTRFERPGADATLALNMLAEGELSVEEAQARVTADLFDTYQGKMQETLVAAADENQFPGRRSESASLTQGYWRILADSFAEQVGAESRSQVDADFAGLLAAAIAEDEAATQEYAASLQGAVQNFRAAALSTEELVRRTGQLIRYMSLVPIEYERGVEDGKVFLAFEIQEAVTFMSGAQAAFADLRPTLYLDNPELVETVQAQLNEIEADLALANRNEAVLPVREMQHNVTALDKNLNELLPDEWNQLDPDADFDVIATVLDQVETAVAQGQYEMAESAHLEAYAVFDFGPEPHLLAFAPEQVALIDGLFWQGYNGERGLAEALALKESPETIASIRANLDEALMAAQRTLGDLPSAPGAIITNAAIIVFREGLEAVVILAALTASFVGVMSRYRRYVGLGALAAFIATILTGILMQQLLSSFVRFGERLEAVVSLVAIGVILLITNWFFHKAYWTDHMKNQHVKKSGLMKETEAGQVLGLVMLGFTSIYREGFETALFLQALLLDAGPSIVLRGIALGMVGVILAGVFTFVLQRKLPYMKMFVATAFLIGLVLITMIGHTVHIMQKVGWMTLHPIKGLNIPYWTGLWFGLFPTWESIGGQVAAAVFVIGSYYLAEFYRHREREKLRQKREARKRERAAKQNL
ncbi:MAG: iron permease [Chloroflexi bacterium]|nr:MAG: iron permease [Chloroflexota bacterium]PIE82377.1 MAG: iron permease [Chloroflexota bacterium]